MAKGFSSKITKGGGGTSPKDRGYRVEKIKGERKRDKLSRSAAVTDVPIRGPNSLESWRGEGRKRPADKQTQKNREKNENLEKAHEVVIRS